MMGSKSMSAPADAAAICSEGLGDEGDGPLETTREWY
jgi:hypothetical protein